MLDLMRGILRENKDELLVVQDMPPGLNGQPGNGPALLLGVLHKQMLWLKAAIVKVFSEEKHGRTAWQVKRQQLSNTLAGVLHLEQSLESHCTCLVCMRIFKEPVTCWPCGHTYCRACLDKLHQKCRECGGSAVEVLIPNIALDSLCSKYECKMSSLQRVIQEMNRPP